MEVQEISIRLQKKSSELIIKNYELLFGIKFTILRYTTAYGPRNRKVDAISIFVERALKNLDLIIYGDGQQKRNYLYVEDLANGSMLAFREKTKNKIITLASKNNIKIVDLARTIIKLTNSKSKIFFDKKISVLMTSHLIIIIIILEKLYIIGNQNII